MTNDQKRPKEIVFASKLRSFMAKRRIHEQVQQKKTANNKLHERLKNIPSLRLSIARLQLLILHNMNQYALKHQTHVDDILCAVQYLDPLSAQLVQSSFTHLIAGLGIVLVGMKISGRCEEFVVCCQFDCEKSSF